MLFFLYLSHNVIWVSFLPCNNVRNRDQPPITKGKCVAICGMYYVCLVNIVSCNYHIYLALRDNFRNKKRSHINLMISKCAKNLFQAKVVSTLQVMVLVLGNYYKVYLITRNYYWEIKRGFTWDNQVVENFVSCKGNYVASCGPCGTYAW